MDTINAKAQALAKYLEIDIDAAEKLIDDGDWLVLTDDEAEQAARDYILDSVWAFLPSFLARYSDVADESVFEAIAQNGKCENNNKATLKLISDVDHFVREAILSDGRGNFLSGYDGEEVALDGDLFAYRCN